MSVSDRGVGTGELRALLLLRALPGLGDVRLRHLVGRYGTAAAALAAGPTALGREAWQARGSRPILGRVDRSMETIERLGVVPLTEDDPRYPVGLRELHDPPFILFARGHLELLRRPAIAVVGSRGASPYGVRIAETLAEELAHGGFVIVSGMARGIDAAAHKAALGRRRDVDDRRGTIGVLGCGIDVVYPRGNEELYARVATDGLLLSEFLPGEGVQRYNFPRRNRIIAALCEGVVVVEAAERSGALITVDHALDLGREVFAVPGPIGRATSVGCHRLIQQGAKLTTCVADIHEELRYDVLEDAAFAGMHAWTGAEELAAGGMTAGGVSDGGVSDGGVSDGGVSDGGARARAPAGAAGHSASGQRTVRATANTAPPPGLSAAPRRVWGQLELDPLHIDEVAARTGLDPARTLAALLELELAGYARQVAGLRFVRA